MALQSTTALATITLQEASSTVEFSGIPDTYRDLILVANFKTALDSTLYVRINDDSNSNYTLVRMWGTGSAPSGDSRSQTYWDMEAGDTSTQWSVTTLEILDYSATDKHKTALYRTNQNYVAAGAERWASNSAINKISIATEGSSYNFLSGTTFALFGRIA